MGKAADRSGLLAAGIAKAKAGRHSEALKILERALKLGADAALLNAIAITKKALGDIKGARAAYDRALVLEPANPDLLFNLAKLDMDGRRPAAAALLLERALGLRESAAAWKNLGVCRLDLGDGKGAVAAFTRLGELVPNDPLAWSYLGVAWQQLGDLIRAEQAHARAVQLAPGSPDVLNNLGSTLVLQRRWAEAEALFRQALARQPDYADAHYGLAQLLLGAKRFAEGWPEWEWRTRRARFAEPKPTAPYWDGTPFKGTLVVHAEIGLGDSLLFARFLPQARARCDRVVFVCQAPLVRLLDSSFSGIEFVATDDRRRPKGDRFCYVMSLPGFFVADTADIKGAPYLSVPAGAGFDLGPAEGKKRIGLSWSSTRKDVDPHRFVPGAELADIVLKDHPGASFFMLQKGLAAEEKAALAPFAIDLEERLGDFADTAAIVAQLDLVISVDTVTVHVAGGLGVPCLVLLNHGADWRWFEAEDTTPWYDSARLIRQPDGCGWTKGLQAVRAELDRFLS
ncbi:tetratricopeptide repeat protein [Magnetospirillum moscoviense]|uniref:Glycosyltransferase n=1 Tax=Magnetospirillum moscoviense TaxID=1437059 RepID=A0A178MQP6_9PROT|nr:tetratricopeptide repeat protein [Magnetospirillum moscoviense]OAN50395.1 hypothetical protein A6A05_12595 [Magnetospirillum moscoviense]